MRPLLNPVYWDGKILGEATAEIHAPSADRTTAKFAIDAIECALGLSVEEDPPVTLTYGSGSEFPRDHHLPGTVVLLNQEMLFRQSPAGPHVDMNDFRAEPVPDRYVGLDKRFMNRAKLSFKHKPILGGGLVYQNLIRYGVVAPGGQGLITINGGSVCLPGRVKADDWNKGQNGPPEVETDIALARFEPGPMPIGRVRHQRIGNHRGVRLVRNNVLQILAVPHQAEAA